MQNTFLKVHISRIIFFSTCILFLFLPLNGACDDSVSPEKQPSSQDAWHILADEISYDHDSDVYIAIGHVIVSGKDKKITADYIRYEKKNMKLFARGNAIFTSGEDVLKGDSLYFDLDKETGEVSNGTVFIEFTHFYLKGEKIEKTGEKTYYLEEVSITTCPPDDPDWKITGEKVRVTLEGYGVVHHAALWIGKVPVAYVPYFIFPAKTERQTGFLPPWFMPSKRRGYEYEQPFFWAISDSVDATFYSHYLSKRGEKTGLEVRYVLDHQSKGTIMFDYLKDSKVDTGVGDETDDWGYWEEGDGDNNWIRPNKDRYWFRMKQDHYFTDTLSAKLDLDIVSDQDYLQDFYDGYSGFDQTNVYFGDTFGRTLDDYEDDLLTGDDNKVRKNRINLHKKWDRSSLDAEVIWNDHVINRTLEDTDSTEQKLPVVNFSASRQQVGDSSLYWGITSEYVRYYRADGDSDTTVQALKMHRANVYPTMYLDLGYAPFFSFEPSVGFQETGWYVDEYEDDVNATSDDPDQTLGRSIYDVKLDLSTDVEKIFANVNFFGINSIKHTITPQITYNYIPELDQTRYPDFKDDFIAEMDLITFSLANTFTSKKIPVNISEKNKEADELKPVYEEFCYFKLSQSYDRNEADAEDPEPFQPLTGELRFNPFKYLSLGADAKWSHYDSRFLSHNVRTTLSDARGDRVSCERRFTLDENDTIVFDLYLVLLHQLFLTSNLEYNLETEKKIETDVGLIYKADCWSLDFTYTEKGDDWEFGFRVTLVGLGSVGI